MVRPSNTYLKECVLTFPNRLLRAMSAYAERKAADRAAEIRLNTTHSLSIFGRYWSSLWQQLVLKGHTTFPDVCRWSSQLRSVMIRLQLHMSCAKLCEVLFASSERRPNFHSTFFYCLQPFSDFCRGEFMQIILIYYIIRSYSVLKLSHSIKGR